MLRNALSSSAPRLWGALVLALSAALANGCGGGSGKLMVDSPLTAFSPPDEDELAGDEDDDADEAKPAHPDKVDDKAEGKAGGKE